MTAMMMHRYRCPLKKWQTTLGPFWRNNQTLLKTPFARWISVLPSEQLDDDDNWSMTGFVHRRGDDVRPIKGTWWLWLLPCTSCPFEPGHNSETHFQFNLTFIIRNFHHCWTFTSYHLSHNFYNSLSLSSNLNFPFHLLGDRSVPGEPEQHPPSSCSPSPPAWPPLLCPLNRLCLDIWISSCTIE